MESHSELEGLTFYFTWDVKKLPTYGSEVVAVILGDEWCRLPRYERKVRAIFKCYGTRPAAGWSSLKQPYLNALALLQYLRLHVYRAPGQVHRLINHVNGDDVGVGRTFAIPLGYANQSDLPIKDITARRHDVFFAGSVNHLRHPVWSPKRWLPNPKQRSRKKMIASLTQLKKRRTDLNIALHSTPHFTLGLLERSEDRLEENVTGNSYSQEMMDTKICVAPRGASLETFRFFEGMRYGCVVITEALPSRWFYDGAPAIRIDNWNRLNTVIENLLSDEARLRKKHRQALRWWEEKCSEEALGRFMAEKLRTTEVAKMT